MTESIRHPLDPLGAVVIEASAAVIKASGTQPVTSQPSTPDPASLPAYVSKDDPLDNTDLVVWYTFGRRRFRFEAVRTLWPKSGT